MGILNMDTALSGYEFHGKSVIGNRWYNSHFKFHCIPSTRHTLTSQTSEEQFTLQIATD